MKKLFLILLAGIISLAVPAQGNSGNSKGKSKNNPTVTQPDYPGKSGEHGNVGKNKDKEKDDKAKDNEHDKKVWDGIGDKSCMKPSKNQPAKVREAFQRDYPNAINVRWTKCRGDWTATFNGLILKSTAIYHANGERKDTRTPVGKESIPKKVIEEIFKKRPDARLDEVIKIEIPNVVKDIFRIKNILDGKTQYEYYNADGEIVQYDY
jgi:hypothetical protein